MKKMFAVGVVSNGKRMTIAKNGGRIEPIEPVSPVIEIQPTRILSRWEQEELPLLVEEYRQRKGQFIDLTV